MMLRQRASAKEALESYLFLMPNFLGFLFFTSLPVAASLLLSFFDWDIIGWPPRFVGLGNFIKLLGFHLEGSKVAANDPFFWQYTYNTVFLMMSIPLNMAASLAIAAALNKKLKGTTLFRTTYFLPSMCSAVAVAILWKWMFNTDTGIINTFIGYMGNLFGASWQGVQWLTSTKWAKPALILMSLWVAAGGANMILYLAALQGVPRELLEAAEIDGATTWQKFRHITWPMISPTTFFIAIMSIIGGFQGGFLAAYIMTGGGPAGSTTTIEYYIFNNLYVFQHAGYAAAIAWVLFLVILCFTLINWRLGGRLVHY